LIAAAFVSVAAEETHLRRVNHFSVGAKQVLSTCFAPTEKWLTRRRCEYTECR
jgi:hypothetical protein